jgi:single-stranded DNA-binding protein
MSAFALVSGQLFKAPEQRTSKAGKPFVTATIRAKDGDDSKWWHVTAFSETAQPELMRLGDGDAVSVQGPLKVETYEKDGATKVSLSVVAGQVLALRQPPRERKAPASGPQRAAPYRGVTAAFNDSRRGEALS